MPALTTPAAQQGWTAPDFRLKGPDGKWYMLQDVKGPKGLLVMFICNHCPYVQAIADKIALEAKALATLDIGCIAIMPNDTRNYPEDSLDNMGLFQKKHHFTFPYVIDDTQAVAKAYGAVCTPDFFGFDSNLTLQYRGRLDASGMERIQGGRRELYEAMKQVAETGRAPAAQNPSIGCSIKWRDG
jgi:peroxiredoxin